MLLRSRPTSSSLSSELLLSREQHLERERERLLELLLLLLLLLHLRPLLLLRLPARRASPLGGAPPRESEQRLRPLCVLAPGESESDWMI
jgi:hypothetical protein